MLELEDEPEDDMSEEIEELEDELETEAPESELGDYFRRSDSR
jgi:hypothetical protein